MNHLESLTAEYLETQGYFVRKNVQVAPRPQGGYDGELDVVAIHPVTRHVLHVEPSLDALSWSKREERFARKFALGRAHIPHLLDGLDAPADIDQVALLVFASRKNVTRVAGARLLLVSELMHEIVAELRTRPVEQAAVPEQFPCLRSIQFACQFTGVGTATSSAEAQHRLAGR